MSDPGRTRALAPPIDAEQMARWASRCEIDVETLVAVLADTPGLAQALDDVLCDPAAGGHDALYRAEAAWLENLSSADREADVLAMGRDPDYRAEAIALEAEYAATGWETLKLGDLGDRRTDAGAATAGAGEG